MTECKDSSPSWLVIGAIALFLVHAANYLHFFVDDEAIPFVYAQNLLHGQGFSYNAIEGRLEGYSDFLHVLWSTVILAVVRAAHLPKDTVFFAGKAVSLVCGIGILLLVWRLARRARLHQVSVITALGTLALAGPLAVWSCSSLEAVPVALITTGLIVALVADRDGWVVLAASLLVLERIDGFIYAGLVVGAFLVTAPAHRRREMLRRVVMPVGLLLLAYHGWRWWYFNDLVPAPIEAKILYKLHPSHHVAIKTPDRPYALDLIRIYGWPAAFAVAASTAYALRSGGWIRRLAIAVLPLTLYVSVVGDWMFGFRFFVPLLPFFALIVANSVERIAVSRPRLAAALCMAGLVYGAVVATRFSDTYLALEQTLSFLHRPSRDLHRFFWPYYGLYETARGMVFPGDVVAYNQAGFVPFMLDANNIDDLGICSRFPAEVPSTDIYFTEVGRYAPLTNKKTLRPVQAYLLYQNVRFIISRTDILARANHDQLPPALFGGLYELVGTDSPRQNAIYRRSESPLPIRPGTFTENVAHVSYVRDARIGDSTIDPTNYLQELPFLRDEGGTVRFSGRTQITVEFSSVAERVVEISIEHIRASADADVQLRLMTPGGHVANQFDVALAANRDQRMSFGTAHTVASGLVLTLDAKGADGELWIDDLRVQGQRHALQDYVTTHLHFSYDGGQDY